MLRVRYLQITTVHHWYGKILLSFFSSLTLVGVTIFKRPLALLGNGSPEKAGLPWTPNREAVKWSRQSNIILFTSLLFGGIKLSLFLGFNHGSATATAASPGFTFSPTTILGSSALALAPTTLPSSPFCFTSISLYQYFGSLVKWIGIE